MGVFRLSQSQLFTSRRQDRTTAAVRVHAVWKWCPVHKMVRLEDANLRRTARSRRLCREVCRKVRPGPDGFATVGFATREITTLAKMNLITHNPAEPATMFSLRQSQDGW